MNAKHLRERFNGIFEIQRDVEARDDWPKQSVEEQRLKALFSIVGDIIIWIEEQEKNNEHVRHGAG